MERMYIKDKDFIIMINDDNTGCKFYDDGRIEKIDESFLDYFKILICPKDAIKYGEENGYEVYLDKKNNFKHYIKNGKEDFKMFFLNNGEDTTLYLKQGDNSNSFYKKYTIIKDRGECMIMATLTSLVVFGIILTTGKYMGVYSDEYIINTVLPISSSMSLNDVKKEIYKSVYLTDEEKEYIYNETLITDILNTCNGSKYITLKTKEKLKDLKIKPYHEGSYYYEVAKGYYSHGNPNTINIKDYSELGDAKNTVAHEIIHLWQHEFGYKTLKEATAEIISDEYYDAKVDSYTEQVKITKLLMEIIGPDAIWNNVFTGDASIIESRVRPYISDEEYQTFINYLSSTSYGKNEDMLSILNTLYKNINGITLDEDEICNLILKDATMKRIYFNTRKMIQDYSYYVIEDEVYKEKTYGFKEAENKGVLRIYDTKTMMTDNYDDAKKFLEKNIEYSMGKLERLTDVDILYDNETKTFYVDVNGERLYGSTISEIKDKLIQIGMGKYKASSLKRVSYDVYKQDYLHEKTYSFEVEKGEINVDDEEVKITEVEKGEINVNLPLITEREYSFDETYKK